MLDDGELLNTNDLPEKHRLILAAAAEPTSIRVIAERVDLHEMTTRRFVRKLVDQGYMRALPQDGKLVYYQSRVTVASPAVGPYKVKVTGKTLDDTIKILADEENIVNHLGRAVAATISMRKYNAWAEWHGAPLSGMGEAEGREYLEALIRTTTRLLAIIRELYHIPELWNTARTSDLFEERAPTAHFNDKETYRDLVIEFEAYWKQWNAGK